jgi:hypothetical protein
VMASRKREWLIASAVLGAAGLLALGSFVYSARVRRDRDALLYIPKQSTVSGSALLLERYIRIRTVNPPGNEIEGARFLAAHGRASL